MAHGEVAALELEVQDRVVVKAAPNESAVDLEKLVYGFGPVDSEGQPVYLT